MLSFVAPLIAYLLSFPVMLVTLFRVEIGLLFFITLVPIIAAMQKLAAFPQGRNLPDFLLISMTLGWVLTAQKEGRKVFESSPINAAVVLLILASIINLVRGYTFMELPSDVNLIRLMTWKNYMILPLIYFIARNNLRTEKNVKWVIMCISLTMLVTVYSFYSTFRWLRVEHYSDSIRISGTFSFLGPNEMGIFYAMYTFLLLGISYFIEDKKLKYFVLFVCACNFYPLLYSFSRAGYTCAIAGILTLGILKDRRLLIVLFALLILYRVILPTAVVERIDMTFLDNTEINETQEQSSAVDVGGVTVDTVGRKELWERAKEYFYEHPLLGIGFDTFRHREGMITHSFFLKILAEQGLIGVLVFLIFIGCALSQSYKLFRHSTTALGRGIGCGFFTCVVVHLTGGITGDQSLYYNLMAIYWLFLGIVATFNMNFLSKTGPPNLTKPIT
ncbi:MAG: O-antigen ligase family protein [Candidatus Hodarchaeota archaeon]